MITRFGYYYNTFGKQIPIGAKLLPTFGKIHSAHPDFPLIATQYIRYLVSEEKINSKLKSRYTAFDEDAIQTANFDMTIEVPEDLTIEEVIETLKENILAIPGGEKVSTNLDKTEVEEFNDMPVLPELTIEEPKEATIENLVEAVVEEIVEESAEEVTPEMSENLDKNVEEVKQDEVVAVVDKPTETKKSRKTSKPKSNEQKEG